LSKYYGKGREEELSHLYVLLFITFSLNFILSNRLNLFKEKYMNLLVELKQAIGKEIIQKVAILVGEKEEKVSVAIEGLVPTIVGGLMKRVSNEAGANTLMNVIQKGNHDGSILKDINTVIQDKDKFSALCSTGGGLVSMLLPDKKSSIATMISQFAGVRNSSATSLLALVTSIIVGKLGSNVQSQNLDKFGLANALLDEKSTLLDETPESLQPRMIDVLGLSTFMSQEIKPIQYASAGPIKTSTTQTQSTSKAPADSVSYSTKEYDEENSFTLPSWLLPAVGIAAVLAILGYFLSTYDWSSLSSNSNSTEDTTQIEQVTNATIDTTTNTDTAKIDSSAIATTAANKEAAVTLPNGEQLSVPEGGFNFNFSKYLTDSSSKAGRVFTFDNLNFESNTTNLVAGSEKTVTDLAKIMTAYPRVQVKLTGYTDNTGDSLMNKKISIKRAFAVRNLLVGAGISDIRIDFAGKGSANPVASNATEEGKAKNRRLEMRVIKK